MATTPHLVYAGHSAAAATRTTLGRHRNYVKVKTKDCHAHNCSEKVLESLSARPVMLSILTDDALERMHAEAHTSIGDTKLDDRAARALDTLRTPNHPPRAGYKGREVLAQEGSVQAAHTTHFENVLDAVHALQKTDGSYPFGNLIFTPQQSSQGGLFADITARVPDGVCRLEVKTPHNFAEGQYQRKVLDTIRAFGGQAMLVVEPSTKPGGWSFYLLAPCALYRGQDLAELDAELEARGEDTVMRVELHRNVALPLCQAIGYTFTRSELFFKEESSSGADDVIADDDNDKFPTEGEDDDAEGRDNVNEDWMSAEASAEDSEADGDKLSDEEDEEGGTSQDEDSSFVDASGGSNDSDTGDGEGEMESMAAEIKNLEASGNKRKPRRKAKASDSKDQCDHVLLTTLGHGHLVIRQDDPAGSETQRLYRLSGAIRLQYLNRHAKQARDTAAWVEDYDTDRVSIYTAGVFWLAVAMLTSSIARREARQTLSIQTPPQTVLPATTTATAAPQLSVGNAQPRGVRDVSSSGWGREMMMRTRSWVWSRQVERGEAGTDVAGLEAGAVVHRGDEGSEMASAAAEPDQAVQLAPQGQDGRATGAAVSADARSRDAGPRDPTSATAGPSSPTKRHKSTHTPLASTSGVSNDEEEPFDGAHVAFLPIR